MICFFERLTEPEAPGGITVSKRSELPSGDFQITEYYWGEASLWFIDDDQFTDDERQESYELWVSIGIAKAETMNNETPTETKGSHHAE